MNSIKRKLLNLLQPVREHITFIVKNLKYKNRQTGRNEVGRQTDRLTEKGEDRTKESRMGKNMKKERKDKLKGEGLAGSSVVGNCMLRTQGSIHSTKGGRRLQWGKYQAKQEEA